MYKKFFYCCGILLLINNFSQAQLYETFSDSNFSRDPIWVGDTTSFIVNNLNELESNNTTENSRFYLSTKNQIASSAQWEFSVKINFNSSSSNYIDAYLTSLTSDFTAVSNIGYFVRLGNTDDEISLYRKDSDGTITKIIDGENGVLNHSTNVMKIKVVCTQSHQWILYRDMSGTENSFVKEGVASDSNYLNSNYFGFLIKQSTSSFFQKHFFDDIEIKKYVADVTAPEIVSVTAISSASIDILFNEPIDPLSDIFSNYSANNGLGMPSTVIIDSKNPALVHLTFTNSFTNGYAYTLIIKALKDLAGNEMISSTSTFSFHVPEQYDVVIDELMADPSPEVGLPDFEWIELKNISSFPIDLKGWRLSDLNSSSGPFPEYILQPDSFIIVSASAGLSALAAYSKTISVTNFPSLDNGNDLISVADASGKIIHAIQYSDDWYQNELKKDGGWSLEMIDTKNPCNGFSNWIASKDKSGGTPGRKNSTDGINKDERAPKLVSAFENDSKTITVVYNEPLDSLKAASVEAYTFNNGLRPINAIATAPLFEKVNITLNMPIEKGIIYNISANNISDCSGNIIGEKNFAKFGWAESADTFDVVINEILFHPLSAGVDYVEIYNRSKKIIDLKQLFIANRNTSNVISSIKRLSEESLLLFPEEFMAVTIDPDVVKSQYISLNPDAFLKIKSLPSFSNDEGKVILLNEQGNILDEVDYSDKWHFPLLHNTEGVSLERIDYNAPSVQSNFHSAATSVGYGTPGYKNSQYKTNEEVPGEITISPEIFSPDNDGNEDFATINYSFPSPGYVANITVFDASGRPVRFLQKNSLSGIKGFYRWDGLDDRNKKLPQGIYIIYTEIFNKEGKKKQFKNSIVLARRNN
jgi:hypothetical protein